MMDVPDRLGTASTGALAGAATVRVTVTVRGLFEATGDETETLAV